MQLYLSDLNSMYLQCMKIVIADIANTLEEERCKLAFYYKRAAHV